MTSTPSVVPSSEFLCTNLVIIMCPAAIYCTLFTRVQRCHRQSVYYLGLCTIEGCTILNHPLYIQIESSSHPLKQTSNLTDLFSPTLWMLGVQNMPCPTTTPATRLIFSDIIFMLWKNKSEEGIENLTFCEALR